MTIPFANRLSQVEEYYFSSKLQEVRRLVQEGRHIINLAIGNPDLPPSAATVETLCQSAAEGHHHGYQPYRGIPELRSAMAGWYERLYGVTLNPDTEILPLIGSKEGIFHISMAFLNPGDQVLVPDPGYLGYPAAARLMGAEVRYYDLREQQGWRPDLTALRRTDTRRVKIMWINYPHMPTGALADRDNFQQLVDFARERNILLCHDNPYSLILNHGAPQSILQFDHARECCLELNSLSKSHNMAGWRVGMVAGRRDYLDAILKVKSNIDSGMFLPVQQAAVQALQNSQQWHHHQNEVYQKRRRRLQELLNLLNCRYATNTSGLFVWAKVPEAIEDVEAFLDELLYSVGIFFAPGKVFGKNGQRYLRASVCAPEEAISQAIDRIQNL